MTRRDEPDKTPKRQKRPGDSAFDIWLKRGLHQLYGDIAEEPIPDALLRLIERDRDRDSKE
ncbi:MAG: hypothetical protein JOY70_07995 [Acidisphaera sp.]|nr:hypothetical protein [Acidisphaera sp.]MBV9812784.1 hypothetical protein [Acetobacteraceae bacterium]